MDDVSTRFSPDIDRGSIGQSDTSLHFRPDLTISFDVDWRPKRRPNQVDGFLSVAFGGAFGMQSTCPGLSNALIERVHTGGEKIYLWMTLYESRRHFDSGYLGSVHSITAASGEGNLIQ